MQVSRPSRKALKTFLAVGGSNRNCLGQVRRPRPTWPISPMRDQVVRVASTLCRAWQSEIVGNVRQASDTPGISFTRRIADLLRCAAAARIRLTWKLINE